MLILNLLTSRNVALIYSATYLKTKTKRIALFSNHSSPILAPCLPCPLGCSPPPAPPRLQTTSTKAFSSISFGTSLIRAFHKLLCNFLATSRISPKFCVSSNFSHSARFLSFSSNSEILELSTFSA